MGFTEEYKLPCRFTYKGGEGLISRVRKVSKTGKLPIPVRRKSLRHIVQQKMDPRIPTQSAHGRRASPSRVLLLADDQMAKQKAILFTKSARLYTRFKVLSSTDPIR